jgi:rhodanese-related sulfurtransferase
MKTLVNLTPPASSDIAAVHYAARLAVETDCADVYAGLQQAERDFVLLDVRSAELYAAGHVPGATSLPHRQISAERLAEFPSDSVFVTYCAGPHCNGSTKAALKIARLGRPVKEMIGGITGWLDEGFALAST